MICLLAAIMLYMVIPNHPDSQERDVFAAALIEACSAMQLPISNSNIDLMWAHFFRLTEANRHFNLTRITSVAEAAVKHYADSLSLLAMPLVGSRDRLSVLDVGTGGGFPAIPLAIMQKAWHITAIDGTG